MHLQFAEIEFPGLLLDEGEYVVSDYSVTLPATTTSALVHGVCVSGATAAYASSTNSSLTYTPVKSFSGSVQGWGDSDIAIEGMEGMPCSEGIYLMPSLYEATPVGTAISIDLEWTDPSPTICVYVKSPSNPGADETGGFLQSLTTLEFGFTNYGTISSKYAFWRHCCSALQFHQMENLGCACACSNNSPFLTFNFRAAFGWESDGVFLSFDLLCKGLTTAPTIIADKVRVQLTGQNNLHLTEVMVYDRSGINVALNKPSTQSSSPYGQHEASKANNGNMDDYSKTQNDQGEHCIACVPSPLSLS